MAEISIAPRPVYSGEYRHALDEKNRVTVPSDWRRSSRDSEEFFSIPDHTGEFLMLMPPDEFQLVRDKVNANDKIEPHQRKAFIRQFYSRARCCGMDRQGRIVIPEDHREQAKLEGDDVVLVGSRDHFEIWQPGNWDRMAAAETETYQRVAHLIGL